MGNQNDRFKSIPLTNDLFNELLEIANHGGEGKIGNGPFLTPTMTAQIDPKDGIPLLDIEHVERVKPGTIGGPTMDK
jgi:hypothetical protein